MAIIPSSVPAELKDLAHWVLWRETLVKNKKGEEHLTKKPLCVNGRGLESADSTDPKTWTTYDRARQQAAIYKVGIGFCFQNSGLAGIDYDGCLDPATGQIDEWALSRIRQLDSYCEVSPSGNGVKQYFRASLPGPGKKAEYDEAPYGKKRAFEIYDKGRFFAVTGNRLSEFPATIENRDLGPIYEFICQERERLRRGRHARKDQLIIHPDDSSFDVEAFLSRHHIPVLGKDKHDSKDRYIIECQGTHGGYDVRDGRAFILQMASGALAYGCLHETCSHYNELGNHWQELRARLEPNRLSHVALPQKASETKKRIWMSHAELIAEVAKNPMPEIAEGFIPEHSANICVGESSIGKTPFALQLALCVSHGIPFLGMPTRQCRVLLVDYENTEYELSVMLGALCRHLGIQSPVGSDWLHILLNRRMADVFEEVVEFQPGLIIVDALRGFDPTAEKGNTEAAELFNALRVYKTAWILIHHPRKNPKDAEEKPIPLKDAKRVVDWLDRASGARALVNQSMVRIAIDSIHSQNEDGGDLIMRWHFKGRADQGPLIIGRQFDEEGEPLGYYHVTGIELLKPDHKGWLAKLLAGREQTEPMRRIEVESKLAASQRKVYSFIEDCTNAGLVIKTGQARTKDARYAFHIGGNVSFPGNPG